MSSLTLYPYQTSPITHPWIGVDGYASHGVTYPGDTWATIRDGAGNQSAWQDTAEGIRINGSDQNKWELIRRNFLVFPLSEIEPSYNITAAKLRLYAHSKADALSISPSVNICAASLANYYEVVAGDYDCLLGQPFYCDTKITYANWVVDTWVEFEFNTTGLAAITGNYLEIGLIETDYDYADNEPGTTNGESNMYWRTSEYGGDPGAGTHRPELIITYEILTPVTSQWIDII